MAVGERESSQPVNASHREGEEIGRDRKSSVVEGTGGKDIEGATKQVKMVEARV